MMPKPPLGLKPRWLCDEERIADIKAAINRAFIQDYPINQDWFIEYNEIAERIQKRLNQPEGDNT